MRPVTAFRTGTKQVTTAGTRVQLADSSSNPSVEAITVAIQAFGTNTGAVVIGDANVVALAGTQGSATQRGIRLAANDVITIDVIDIAQIWVDALNNGDGVSWLVGAA